MTPLNSRANAEDRHYRELLAQSASGSHEAFRQLYDLVYAPLLRFIYRYNRSNNVIQEVLNDTMLVVWRKAGSFRGDSRVMTWVLGIARRRALKAVQREQAWKTADASAAGSGSNSGDTDRLDTLDALEWALRQLSTEQSLAIELAYFHGMSCEEIAVVLECPLNTAKTRLHYARKRLRAVFAEDGQTLEFNDLIDEASR